MSKVVNLIKSIDAFVTQVLKEEESLTDSLPEFEGREIVEGLVEEFEKVVANLLRRERKRFLDEFKSFVSKDDRETLEAILNYFREEVFNADTFAKELSEAAASFLRKSVSEFSSVIMETVDKDVPFQILSKRTTEWIETWSDDLGELMQLSSQGAVEKILTKGIENGESIDKIERALADLPEFSRRRARTTAITEVLTASSAAQYESYSQSPAVTGKQWKHSGPKGITPRENHVALDGTIVRVDEPFVIPDSEELAMFPRDPQLTAKERVNCHCAMGPAVDESILGLTKEEKEAIRQEVLAELNS